VVFQSSHFHVARNIDTTSLEKTYEQHLRQLEKFHFNCVVLNLDLLNNKKINFSRLGFVRKTRLIAAAIFKLINGHISWLQFNIEWSVYD